MAKNENKIEKQAEQIMSPELEAMKAQIAKMIEDAKAEAKAIIDDAKEQAKAVSDGKPIMSEEAKKVDDYWNEEVEIQLFKDSGKYKDDVYVAVNGKSYLIKRGEWVDVPAGVAEVLQHKEEMLAQAMEFEAQAAANADQ